MGKQREEKIHICRQCGFVWFGPLDSKEKHDKGKYHSRKLEEIRRSKLKKRMK